MLLNKFSEVLMTQRGNEEILLKESAPMNLQCYAFSLCCPFGTCLSDMGLVIPK